MMHSCQPLQPPQRLLQELWGLPTSLADSLGLHLMVATRSSKPSRESTNCTWITGQIWGWHESLPAEAQLLEGQAQGRVQELYQVERCLEGLQQHVKGEWNPLVLDGGKPAICTLSQWGCVKWGEENIVKI
jgi:hypothetical protein